MPLRRAPRGFPDGGRSAPFLAALLHEGRSAAQAAWCEWKLIREGCATRSNTTPSSLLPDAPRSTPGVFHSGRITSLIKGRSTPLVSHRDSHAAPLPTGLHPPRSPPLRLHSRAATTHPCTTSGSRGCHEASSCVGCSSHGPNTTLEDGPAVLCSRSAARAPLAAAAHPSPYRRQGACLGSQSSPSGSERHACMRIDVATHGCGNCTGCNAPPQQASVQCAPGLYAIHHTHTSQGTPQAKPANLHPVPVRYRKHGPEGPRARGTSPREGLQQPLPSPISPMSSFGAPARIRSYTLFAASPGPRVG